MRSQSKPRWYATPTLLIPLGLAAVIARTGWGKAKEEIAYIRGLLSYVYGYPLVMMGVTRQVLTAAPAPNSEGTAAPIN